MINNWLPHNPDYQQVVRLTNVKTLSIPGQVSKLYQPTVQADLTRFGTPGGSQYKFMSIVSARYNDFTQNNGSLQIIAVDGTHIFQLLYAPISFQDLVNQLNAAVSNDALDMVDYAVFDMRDDQGIVVTDTNLATSIGLTPAQNLTISATGNVQSFMGLYVLTTFVSGVWQQLSIENSIRIQYINLQCSQATGIFSSLGVFNADTVSIADPSTNFSYANKTLDIHLPINGQILNFRMVDQTGRDVVISYAFLEIVFYKELYFMPEGGQGFIDGTIVRDQMVRDKLLNTLHQKSQQYIYLSPTTTRLNLGRKINWVAISDIQGTMKILHQTLQTDYKMFYNIYLAQMGSMQPLAQVIVTSNLVLQPSNRNMWMWDQCTQQGELSFRVMQLSADLTTETEVFDYPHMIIRLLVK